MCFLCLDAKSFISVYISVAQIKCMPLSMRWTIYIRSSIVFKLYNNRTFLLTLWEKTIENVCSLGFFRNNVKLIETAIRFHLNFVNFYKSFHLKSATSIRLTFLRCCSNTHNGNSKLILMKIYFNVFFYNNPFQK